MTRCPPDVRNETRAEPTSPEEPVTATVSGSALRLVIDRRARRSPASCVCRYAKPECSRELPPVRDLSETHQVACHLYRDTAENMLSR